MGGVQIYKVLQQTLGRLPGQIYRWVCLLYFLLNQIWIEFDHILLNFFATFGTADYFIQKFGSVEFL